jgi:hypothetical protein
MWAIQKPPKAMVDTFVIDQIEKPGTNWRLSFLPRNGVSSKVTGAASSRALYREGD